MQRDFSADYAKGFGIFLIVWSHIVLGWLLEEVVNTTILGMFFIISGMFYKSLSEKDNIKQVISRQLNRLGIPFLLFVSIGYVFNFFYAVFVDEVPFRYDMVITDFWSGIDYQANIPCWFFIALFEVILMFYFIEKLPNKWIVFVGIVCCVLGAYMIQKEVYYFYFGKSVYYLSLFIWGHYCLRRIRSLLNHRWSGICLMYFSTFLLLLTKILFVESEFIDYCLGGTAAITFTLALLSTFDSINVRFPLLEYCGKNSLVIFAFHIIVVNIVWRLMFPVFHQPGIGLTFVYAIMTIFGCIPMIYIHNAIMHKSSK